jgi:hypothetical protein
MQPHDQHTHRLLLELEASTQVSQRSLARRLGIALGLTNLLLRRVVRKGWVRMIHIRPNRVTYLLTPAGISEMAKMSRDSLQYSLRFYSDARQRVGKRFAKLSTEWPIDRADKRIVFFGTGEIAEIGYVCLQETDLQLVGAIDDQGRRRFFDVPLYSLDWLRETANTDAPYAQLVVMSFGDKEKIAHQLLELGLGEERICWL